MPAAPITAIGAQQALRQVRSSGTGSVHGGPVGTHASPGTAQTRSFGRQVEEVPVARRFVREALAGHPAAPDAELLACELVTNAVQHAADADAVTVTVLRFGQFVHVDVIDDGRIGLPHWREASGGDESGRGFQLVNELSHRWGFLREPGGTCVWFEIAT
jgi:anti-sigma regulatory factor (Ser/Thr protein kinase)